MQARDPDDRAPSVTVGVGRAILSNRLSHYLNIKVLRTCSVAQSLIADTEEGAKYDNRHGMLWKLGVVRRRV